MTPLYNEFIGIFENVVSKEFCEKVISHFDYLEETGYYIKPRLGRNPLQVSDQQLFLTDTPFSSDFELHSLHKSISHEFNSGISECLDNYRSKYSYLLDLDNVTVNDLKVQKTRPGEGFHAWHCESFDRYTANRILTLQLYLNTIEDGGETEFLYQSQRIKPEQGKLLIWPAGYTHIHRGNPPLKDTKYIITTWMTYV